MGKLADLHGRSRSWRWWFQVGWWVVLFPVALACWAATLSNPVLRLGGMAAAAFFAAMWAIAPFADSGGDEVASVPDADNAVTSAPTTPGPTTTTTQVGSSTTLGASSTTASATTTTTLPSTTTTLLDPAVGRTQTAAATLALTDTDPVVFYDRDEYQPDGWPDTDGDCQNDRHEVLIEESQIEVELDPTGCFVDTGLWTDPYDGKEYSDASDVTIDHVIALAHAHRNGASGWDLDTKQAFGSDVGFPGALVVVGAASNQSKSDLSPAEWRPPSRAAWCSFSLDWVQGKQRWGLTYESVAEREAVLEMLATCGVDGQPRPDQLASVQQATTVASTTTTSTTTTIVPVGEAQARILECDERGEQVTIINDGASVLNLARYVLHDEGDKHRFVFPNGTTLEPGERIVVTTGPDAATGPGFILWKRQNVWNNDGDTAFLITPEGSELSRRC